MIELGADVDAGRQGELPRELPGPRLRDRVHGQLRQGLEPDGGPARRQDRGVHGLPRQAERGAGRVLRGPLRQPAVGSAVDPAQGQDAQDQAHPPLAARSRRSIRVDHYLGSTPTFALDSPIKVSKGHIVALTVPTWAPAFAVGLPRTNWWRSSRQEGQVRRRQPAGGPGDRSARSRRSAAHTSEGARLLYTATYVPDPRPTDEPKNERRRAHGAAGAFRGACRRGSIVTR